MTPAIVLPYSPSTLCEVLASTSHNPREVVEAKLHAAYFEEYFAKLSAKTIVVEPEYVDHDFLEDFAAYYVRCFQHYSRKCARVHLFSEVFDDATFARIFAADQGTHRLLQSSYLGFIVDLSLFVRYRSA